MKSTYPLLCIVTVVITAGATVRGQETLDDREFVAGPRVRSAFRDVVADARNWTVRILADGDPVAVGVIVREDGWILTKASRIEGSVACRLVGGRDLAAEQAHVWPQHDLALLKVERTGLSGVRWSDHGDPAVGQWLATSGHTSSPLGVGIVSVGRRSIPLVRLSGFLGVGLEDGDGPATVAEVIEDTAAEKAELKVGDVVIRIDDEVIQDRESMIDYIGQYEPGQKVQLRIRRSDEELTFEATLGQRPSRIVEQNQMGGELSKRRSDFPVVIQHDTVLAPDQCGGTVVDLDGRAVGINIARAGRTESYAIPATVIQLLLEAHFSGNIDPQAVPNLSRLPPPPPETHRYSD